MMYADMISSPDDATVLNFVMYLQMNPLVTYPQGTERCMTFVKALHIATDKIYDRACMSEDADILNMILYLLKMADADKTSAHAAKAVMIVPLGIRRRYADKVIAYCEKVLSTQAAIFFGTTVL